MSYKEYIDSQKLTQEKINNLLKYENKSINKVIANDMYRVINKILKQNNEKEIKNVGCFCNKDEREYIHTLFFETLNKYTYETE